MEIPKLLTRYRFTSMYVTFNSFIILLLIPTIKYFRLEGNRIFEQGKIDKSIELYTKAIQKAGPNNPCYKLFNNR